MTIDKKVELLEQIVRELVEFNRSGPWPDNRSTEAHATYLDELITELDADAEDQIGPCERI